MQKFLINIIILVIYTILLSNIVYGNELIIENYNRVLYLQEGNPRFTLIKQIGVGLVVENRIAYINTECKTYETADISMKAELQREEKGTWKTIKTFSNSERNVTRCSIDKSYAVTKDYNYRVKTIAIVNNGNNTEEITRYSSVRECYNENLMMNYSD